MRRRHRLFASDVSCNVILYHNNASGSFMAPVGVAESTVGKDLLFQANTVRNPTDQNVVLVCTNVRICARL
jgi:hypothetical protein